jgi:hypothetical protein
MGHPGNHEICGFIDIIFEKVPQTVWFLDRKAITQRFDHSAGTLRMYSVI